MKRLLRIITLESAVVSTHRKRQFLLSLVLLILLFCLKVFGAEVIVTVPYATQVIEVLVYTMITNITINVFRIFVVSGHRTRRNISSEEHDNFTVGINGLVNAATGLVTIVFVFIVFNIEFQSFLSTIGLFAVALTLIFQDFIKNFLIGFSVMFSNDYEIGDYIQVGTMPKGVIRNVTFSNVQLKTESGDILYIPNTVIHTSQVLNYSKLKPKRINIDFRLQRSQVASIEAFERRLFLYLDELYPGVFDAEKFRVFVKENTKDDVSFTFEAPTKKATLKLREQVNHAVQKFAVEYQSS